MEATQVQVDPSGGPDPRFGEELSRQFAEVALRDTDLVARLTGAVTRAAAVERVSDSDLGPAVDPAAAGRICLAVLDEAVAGAVAAPGAPDTDEVAALEARLSALQARVEAAHTNPRNVENMGTRDLLGAMWGSRR